MLRYNVEINKYIYIYIWGSKIRVSSSLYFQPWNSINQSASELKEMGKVWKKKKGLLFIYLIEYFVIDK